MKITIIFLTTLILTLLLTSHTEAQKLIKIPRACAVNDSEMGREAYVFEPSKEAQRIVREVTEANFVKPNFIIKSGDVENALAYAENGQRFIVYNTAYIERIKNSRGTDWAAIFVFAHEIGHHLNYHDFKADKKERMHEQELEADVYAGSMMYMLGATLTEAQAGIENVAKREGSISHPPRRARSEAVANGWKRAKERVPVQPPRIQLGGGTRGADRTDNMIFIAGGSFMMGSEDGLSYEKPVHRVTLDDFWMGKYEVTVAEFKAFVDATGYQSDAEKNGKKGSFIWSASGAVGEFEPGINWRHDAEGKVRPQSDYHHPVIHVSWNDATEYCKWLSQKTGKNYHLPTEAEWEYAARSGGKNETYAGFSDFTQMYRYANFCESNCGNFWKYEKQNDIYKYTAPVGSFLANGLGLHDMSGNVWEWCADWFDSNYYQNSQEKNPMGPNSGTTRVLRGGSWRAAGSDCRSAFRKYFSPSPGDNIVGFRVVHD